MKYRLDRYNGQDPRYASSWKQALSIARDWLGVERVYVGASDYVIDSPDAEYQYGTDVWRSRKDAHREMSTPADIVISSPRPRNHFIP